MLERKIDMPPGTIGLVARDRITRQDVHEVLAPILEHARREGRRLRLLVECVDGFHGISPGTVWEDLRIGIHHLRRFERCAVVSDQAWVRAETRFKAMWIGAFDCDLRVFHQAEADEARAWLAAPGPARMKHRLLAEKGILVLEPHGALCAEDFESVCATVDPWLEEHGTLSGVVVRTRAFPGWVNLGAFVSHLAFVRDHHRKVRRVAFVIDSGIADVAQKFATHFVQAEVKHFAYDKLEEALAWAQQTPEPRAQPRSAHP